MKQAKEILDELIENNNSIDKKQKTLNKKEKMKTFKKILEDEILVGEKSDIFNKEKIKVKKFEDGKYSNNYTFKFNILDGKKIIGEIHVNNIKNGMGKAYIKPEKDYKKIFTINNFNSKVSAIAIKKNLIKYGLK